MRKHWNGVFVPLLVIRLSSDLSKARLQRHMPKTQNQKPKTRLVAQKSYTKLEAG